MDGTIGAESVVALDGAMVRLGGRTALRDVDFAVARGEIVTLVGPNGSGKTTLLRLLLGAVPLAAGRARRAAGLRIGYAPQSLTVDATLPLSVDRFLGLPRRASRAERRAALARCGAEDLAERPLAALSGGQFRRALLARAILGRPDVLLLDAPTPGLDQPAVAAFYRLVAAIRAQLGCAVVMAGHDLHVVMSASDRVVCLNGHICCQGTPEVVSSAPAYRALFGHGTAGALALYRHEHDHVHDAAADDAAA